jgi:hypothetical protein
MHNGFPYCCNLYRMIFIRLDYPFSYLTYEIYEHKILKKAMNFIKNVKVFIVWDKTPVVKVLSKNLLGATCLIEAAQYN